MRVPLPPRLARLAFFSLLIAALAAGVTARPVPSGMELQLDVWAMAGLSTDDLCGDHGTDHDGVHCPLCNLAAPAGLPTVTMTFLDAERRILARIVLPQMRRGAGHARDPAIPQRGPPSLT